MNLFCFKVVQRPLLFGTDLRLTNDAGIQFKDLFLAGRTFLSVTLGVEDLQCKFNFSSFGSSFFCLFTSTLLLRHLLNGIYDAPSVQPASFYLKDLSLYCVYVKVGFILKKM